MTLKQDIKEQLDTHLNDCIQNHEMQPSYGFLAHFRLTVRDLRDNLEAEPTNSDLTVYLELLPLIQATSVSIECFKKAGFPDDIHNRERACAAAHIETLKSRYKQIFANHTYK